MDSVVWCAFTFPVLTWVVIWAGSYSWAPAEADRRVTSGIGLAVFGAVHLGVLACLARTAWQRDWDSFGPACWWAIGATAIGWGAMSWMALDASRMSGHAQGYSRSGCKNKIKEILFGFHLAHDRDGHFPVPASGEPLVSWRVTLLPYLERETLFSMYDQSQPWNHPINSWLHTQRVLEYECPSSQHWRKPRDPARLAYTSYALPVGPRAVFDSVVPRSLREIRDGTSNTIALLEVCGMNIIWSEPRDVEIDKVPLGFNLPGSQPGASDGVLSSLHSFGAQVGLADGSVRSIRSDIDPVVLRRLLERDDGQPVGDF